MTSLSIQTSKRRGRQIIAAGKLARVVAILGVLLLAVVVEVVAENYFDPQHLLSSAEMTAQP